MISKQHKVIKGMFLSNMCLNGGITSTAAASHESVMGLGNLPDAVEGAATAGAVTIFGGSASFLCRVLLREGVAGLARGSGRGVVAGCGGRGLGDVGGDLLEEESSIS